MCSVDDDFYYENDMTGTKFMDPIGKSDHVALMSVKYESECVIQAV